MKSKHDQPSSVLPAASFPNFPSPTSAPPSTCWEPETRGGSGVSHFLSVPLWTNTQTLNQVHALTLIWSFPECLRQTPLKSLQETKHDSGRRQTGRRFSFLLSPCSDWKETFSFHHTDVWSHFKPTATERELCEWFHLVLRQVDSRRLDERRHRWHPALTGLCGQDGPQHQHWTHRHVSDVCSWKKNMWRTDCVF